jgi:hypothetical protein
MLSVGSFFGRGFDSHRLHHTLACISVPSINDAQRLLFKAVRPQKDFLVKPPTLLKTR